MGRTGLADFVRFLEDKDLMPSDMIRDDDAQFSSRYRIQKYAFLAQKCGLKLPYEYDLYLFGPYSTQLANDCHDLARGRTSHGQAGIMLEGDSFDADGFLRATKGKDRMWLEIASTLIDVKPYCTDRNQLLKQVGRIKDEIEPEYTCKVLCELEELGLA